MNSDRNTVVKKMLQNIIDKLLSVKKYSEFKKVEVFFVFGSKHRSAMCDWVYGIKVHIDRPLNQELFNQLKLDVKKNIERFLDQSVCCTDVLVEKF